MISDKHNDSINCLIDSLEAMLNQFEKFGIDPEEIAESGQFQVLVHFLKSIIDGKLDVPNDLTERLNTVSKELGLDKQPKLTVH